MGTTISLITAVIALGALIWSILLVRMLLTGDYSLLIVDEEQLFQGELHSRRARAERENTARQSVSGLNLAVANFVEDLPNWEDETERREVADDLAEMRERRKSK